MTEEAEALVKAKLDAWRSCSYDKLSSQVGHVAHEMIERAAGEDWVLESQVVWDDRPGGAVRVIVDVFVPKRQGPGDGSLALHDFICEPPARAG